MGTVCELTHTQASLFHVHLYHTYILHMNTHMLAYFTYRYNGDFAVPLAKCMVFS